MKQSDNSMENMALKHETMGKQWVINLAIKVVKLVEKCKSDGMRLGQVIAAPPKCVLMTCLEV